MEISFSADNYFKGKYTKYKSVSQSVSHFILITTVRLSLKGEHWTDL